MEIRMSGNISEVLIGPCGMNCGICYAFLRKKNSCPGCRLFNEEEPVSITMCKVRNCEFIKSKNVEFCFECKSYPCKNLKNLDKRYRTKYNMSEIENLENIKEYGLTCFVENERKKWTCSDCGGTINVHKKICSNCVQLKRPDTPKI